MDAGATAAADRADQELSGFSSGSSCSCSSIRRQYRLWLPSSFQRVCAAHGLCAAHGNELAAERCYDSLWRHNQHASVVLHASWRSRSNSNLWFEEAWAARSGEPPNNRTGSRRSQTVQISLAAAAGDGGN